jgi:hypothetical protein
MKLNKLACVALSAALIFGAKSVAAGQEFVGTTLDHMKLQFNLMLTSQNPDINKGSTVLWSYSKVKLTNKDILRLLANMAGTTWPDGAQLEYVFDGYRSFSASPKDENSNDQLVVADRTGTNVLFYAGDGVDNNFSYAYFDLDPFDTDGVYQGSETARGSSLGQESYGEVYFADFYFYADYNYNNPDTVVSSPKVSQASSGYWDLWGGGATTETYSEKWSPYSDSGFDNITMTLVGGGYYNDNSQNFINGTVMGVEQWSQANNPQPGVVVKTVGHKSSKKH